MRKASELKGLLEATWGERRSHRVRFWIFHELRELATQPYLLNLIRKQIPALDARVARNETVRSVDLYDGFIEDWSHERNRYHNVLQPEDTIELMERPACSTHPPLVGSTVQPPRRCYFSGLLHRWPIPPLGLR